MTRRELIISTARTAGAFILVWFGRGEVKAEAKGLTRSKAGPGKIAVASKKNPGASTRAAIAALGGMAAFVKKGDKVVIKPNAAWARSPENAATTNPEVVAALVAMCKEAGAKEVTIIEHTIDRPADMVLATTGIKAAAEKAGAKVQAIQNESNYRQIEIPGGKLLKREQVSKDILAADVFINVPIAKVHGATKLTLGMKNLMGIMWNRGAWHNSASLHQCIADFIGAVKPDLTVLDATRILLTNGPKGPGKTKDVGQVIAGTDPVAVDAYGATLFGLKPTDIEHIKLASERGIGKINFQKVKVS